MIFTKIIRGFISAQCVGVGIRQVWLIEQALKIRYKIPKNMSLHEALLLKEDP